MKNKKSDLREIAKKSQDLRVLKREFILARAFAKQFYRSKAWKHTRESYMRSVVDVDGRECPAGLCEKCFKRGFVRLAEIVHHKEHLSPENIDDPNVALGFDNLERLCRLCHAEEHPEIYRESSDLPRVRFDADGNVVPL